MCINILPINLKNIQTQTANRPYNKLNTLNCDTVSFSGNKQKTSLADDFLEKFAQNYPDMDLEDALYEFSSKEENKLGQGAKKTVYSIDKIDDYVVAKLIKPDEKFGNEFVKCDNPYPEYNFSLPVMRNSNFMIMKKLNGEPYGMDDWTAKYRNVVRNNGTIPAKDAKGFLDKITELEKFPLSSFVDFANQAKYLSDNGIKIDFFNPNNVMVDNANKKIQYFDFFDDPSKFLFLKPEINCTQDIICILCDALLHDECMKALNDNDKKNYIKPQKVL